MVDEVKLTVDEILPGLVQFCRGQCDTANCG
jgi:hypothetical protein